MYTRQTSREAFKSVVESGCIGRSQSEVYQILFRYGPLTATQISLRMAHTKSRTAGGNVHARLCELRQLGVVQEVGEAICPVTGRTVIRWDVTDSLPRKPIETVVKVKCCKCDGRGYVTHENFQLQLFDFERS